MGEIASPIRRVLSVGTGQNNFSKGEGFSPRPFWKRGLEGAGDGDGVALPDDRPRDPSRYFAFARLGDIARSVISLISVIISIVVYANPAVREELDSVEGVGVAERLWPI